MSKKLNYSRSQFYELVFSFQIFSKRGRKINKVLILFFFFVQVRVYNYNTMERVYDFEAHSDYLRSIAVHPTLPYIITSSDDMTIKLWDWEKRWENVQVNQQHLKKELAENIA